MATCVQYWKAANTLVPSARVAPLAGARGAAAARLHSAFGTRAPLASALVLARREGLDPELKEAFARSGIAHLLSISGFHVAVVAGLLVAVFRAARVPRNGALLGGVVGVWAYVLLIGAPDAGRSLSTPVRHSWELIREQSPVS